MIWLWGITILYIASESDPLRWLDWSPNYSTFYKITSRCQMQENVHTSLKTVQVSNPVWHSCKNDCWPKGWEFKYMKGEQDKPSH